MDEFDLPTPDVPIEIITPDELKSQIDAGEQLTILDTRMSADYEEWRIEGDSVVSINVPYFEFLDDEISPSILEQLPEDEELIVICAKGGASEYVAGRLIEAGFEAIHLEDGMHGWASIYEAVEITAYEGPGTVFQYQRPSSGCLGYLIYDGDEAAVIDPLRAFTERYIADAADLGTELRFAIDTHIHADHISGVRALTEEGVEGVIPAASAERGATYVDDVTLVTDGDTLTVGDIDIEVMHTPGHTTDMTSYLIGGSLLTTGDGLFIESVARPDLEEGDDGAPEAAQMLHQSLHERVLPMDDEVVIGGAHFSDVAEPAGDGTFTARLGQLTSRMDALSLPEEAFVELILSDMPPRPANYEQIIATNLGLEMVDDEKAFELELGPNNCAASQESLAAD